MHLLEKIRSIPRRVEKALQDRDVARQRRELAEPPTPVLSAEQRRFWDDNGYLVLERAFSAKSVERINRLVESLWDPAQKASRPTVVDIFLDTDGKRVLLRDAPLSAKAKPHKINDLYLEDELIRDFVLEPRLAAILAELLDGPPLVCNTLNLEFGSQQPDHTDSLYMPAPNGHKLVASWIALEKATLDAGPLRYYPGSHKIPPYVFSDGRTVAKRGEMPAYYAYMKSEVGARGLSAQTFAAEPGDLFLWHGQLFHGGEAIRQPGCTRRSIVTHYWNARALEGLHGRLGPGRYWMKRGQTPVSVTAEDH